MGDFGKIFFKVAHQVKKVSLRSFRGEHESLFMKKIELISYYVARILKVMNEMKGYGKIMSNTVVVEKKNPPFVGQKISFHCFSIEESKNLIYKPMKRNF